MARFLYHDFYTAHRRINWFPLAFFFTLGLVAGGYLFLQTDTSFFSMMYLAARSRGSIVSLFCALVLPFLLSAFAVFIDRPCLIFPVAAGKAIAFSYISLGILAAYGDGGWLALLLLMFSNLSVMPALWFFWFCHLDGKAFTAGEMVCYLCWVTLIGSLDYCIVMPFLAAL